MELPICRGKAEDSNKWIIGLVSIDKEFSEITDIQLKMIYLIQDIEKPYLIDRVYKTTICRYTCLDGIDNEAIFEDDIVEIQDSLHEGIKWLVCWDTAYAHFFLLNMNPKPGENTSLDFTQVSPSTIKILGNIHEGLEKEK